MKIKGIVVLMVLLLALVLPVIVTASRSGIYGDMSSIYNRFRPRFGTITTTPGNVFVGDGTRFQSHALVAYDNELVFYDNEIVSY